MQDNCESPMGSNDFQNQLPYDGESSEAVPLSELEPSLQAKDSSLCPLQPQLFSHFQTDSTYPNYECYSPSDELPAGSPFASNLMLLRFAYSDIQNICSKLQIPEEPLQWSTSHVIAWLQETMSLLGLPMSCTDSMGLNGLTLCYMCLDEFRSTFGENGDHIKSCLDLWTRATRFARSSMASSYQNQIQPEPASPESPQALWSRRCTNFGTTFLNPLEPCGSQPDRASSPDSGVSLEDEEKIFKTRTGGTSGSSSQMHLWQFLKLLLDNPDISRGCVRWISRPHGVFKIVSSSDLARLWGERKNRPAMNYDKLSRSLRQYYKKGILQKTPRSQRLIYQFRPPYHY